MATGRGKRRHGSFAIAQRSGQGQHFLPEQTFCLRSIPCRSSARLEAWWPMGRTLRPCTGVPPPMRIGSSGGPIRPDLPIEPPGQYESVCHRQTARALGLTLPSSLLEQVDEVFG